MELLVRASPLPLSRLKTRCTGSFGLCPRGLFKGDWVGVVVGVVAGRKKRNNQNKTNRCSASVSNVYMFEIQFHEILQMPLHDLHLLQVMFAFYKIDLLATWCPTCSVHIHHLEKQKVQLRRAIQSQDFREPHPPTQWIVVVGRIHWKQ